MPDYSKGKIYHLKINGVSFYIGSCAVRLSQRKTEHKRDFIKAPHRKVYQYIAENGGWDAVEIELIEDYPCEDHKSLLKKEGEYIERLNPVGNERKAGTGHGAEWLKNRREYWNAYMREYSRRRKAQLLTLVPANKAPQDAPLN